MKKQTSKKLFATSLALAVAVSSAPTDVFAEDTAGTTWKELYQNFQVDTSGVGDGYYDAVTSATNFSSRHTGDIPSVVIKNTDAEGKITSLIGVNQVIPDTTASKIETGLQKAEWTDSSKYGTDEFVIYPDDTVTGYVWNQYLDHLYAATISDGETTAGAVPWIDYYGEKAESGYHYNKVQIALNSGTSVGANQAVVHRYDAFYDNGTLKPGTYTVTLYSDGFMPLEAEVQVITYEYMYADITQKEYWAKEGVANTDTDADSSVKGNESAGWIPIRVAAEDAEALKAAYPTIANGSTFLENAFADVDRNTNGLKTAIKNADGSFSFEAARTGTGSGLKDVSLKNVETDKITVEAKETEGSSELLHVDLKGDAMNDLFGSLYAVTWKYFGDTNPAENRRASAKAVFGTRPAGEAPDREGVISLGLADTLRSSLPEGTDGTGYWQIVIKALGYSDTTLTFSIGTDVTTSPAPSVVPAALETPSASQSPSATEAPAASQAPVAIETPTASQAPVVTEAPVASQAPDAPVPVKKKSASITVKTKSKTIKARALKKKAQSFSLVASVNSKGKLSYIKVSGSKKITINKNTGKVTVKKKTRKGKYLITVKIRAAATDTYQSTFVTKTIKITVK